MENHRYIARKLVNRLFKTRFFGLVLLMVCLFTAQAKAAGNGHTVVIDAGHGTVVNNRPIEGPTELEIAKKLQARLIADGYKVVMTRTQNGQALGGHTSGKEYVDTRARAEIANRAGAEMVVSIHSDNLKVDAYHILYPDVAGPDKYNVTSPHIDNYLSVAKTMASKINGAMLSSGFKSVRPPHGEAYNNSNDKLGWGKLLMISAHSKAPVITVEVYGHSNPTLVEKYKQASVQDKVAAALQRGVNNYFSVAPKATSAQTTTDPKTTQASGATTNTVASSAVETSPKVDRGDKCPPESETPAEGPAAGQDFRPQVAQAFMAEFSRRTEASDFYNAPTSDYGGEDIITGKGECALPIPGNTHVTSGLTGKRGRAQHRGYDFGAPTGTKIVSVMAGTVVLVEDKGYKDGSGYWGNTSQNGGFGNLIRIKHDNGVYSEYHHVRTGSVGVKTGERVEKGQVIAQVDHNGWSSGAHLHFQLMNQNSSTTGYFDPGKCLGLK